MDARVSSAGLSVGYVGSVYIFPGGRINRDELGVVLRRVVGVIIFTGFITVNFGINVKQWAGTINQTVFRDTVNAVLVSHLLYAGMSAVNGFPRYKMKTWKDRVNVLKTLVVGPVTEESIYRGVVVSLYKDAGYSNRRISMENFSYFGLAHLHHGLMSWLNEEGTAKQISLQSLAHFVITSLFGTYACYLLSKTGSVWPSVASHIVCNYYGPPVFSGSKSYFMLSAASVAAWAYALQYV